LCARIGADSISFIYAVGAVLHKTALQWTRSVAHHGLGRYSLSDQRYAQRVDDDLWQAHKAHSPVDNLARLR
jgi:hypothetical protein